MRCGKEVFVVGGGPAGLAAAIALQREGFAVSVFDCAAPAIDKACGEGLLPDSVAALSELGIRIPELAGFRFRGVCFVDDKSSVVADFPNGPGIGLRRTVLHNLLAQKAKESGASLLWQAKGIRLSDDGLIADGNLIEPDLIAAADGQNSRIRKESGLHRTIREVSRYGFRRHYRLAPWSPYMELHWGERCQLYITPISQTEVCIAVLSRDRKLRLDEALTEFPAIRNRLLSAEPSSAEAGAMTVSRSLRQICRPGLALIGDASGSVDAITGQGLCLAFRQAMALAQALRLGDLSQYERAHRRLSRGPARMASLMLTLETHHWIRRRVIGTLKRWPDIFAYLLAMHVGQASFSDKFFSRSPFAK